MTQTDILIIGAGAVGLATACALGKREIIVLERNRSFGQETSSRNSEVIHAGMYYPQHSLKAQLCTTGSRLLYAFCEQHAVPHARIGKLIIAADHSETAKIEALYATGKANGVPGLSLITGEQCRALEPELTASAALLSEATGIFDTHRYMQTLETLSAKQGVLFAYGCTVTGIAPVSGGYTVTFRDTDGQDEQIRAACVINCAGLAADFVAALAGIDTNKAGYALTYLKGEYFNLTGVKRGITSHLIYPVPGVDSLGIHTVLDLQGQLKLGPNAYPVDSLDYSVDNTYKEDFYHSVKRFLPFVRLENLVPGMAGIRPKRLCGTFADFVICNEVARGLPGFINLIGIESPGLTASLAIGQYVAGLLGYTETKVVGPT